MRAVAPLGLCLGLACGAGGNVAPAKSPEALLPAATTKTTPQPGNQASSRLTAAPAGIPRAPKECSQFVGPAPTSCAPGDFKERLAAALALTPAARDLPLRCLEQASEAPAGLVKALRADLAPRGCADVVLGETAAAHGVGRDLSDALLALGVGARLYRAVRQPPLPRAPFTKSDFLKHFREVLSPWIVDQAHAVDVLSRVGPRLTGYGKAIVALEAGLADLRFVGLARAIQLPEEMKNDPEIRETYLVALEQALEPRVARGRDAALIGLSELSRQGITNDLRLREARQMLSELFAGRRIDALDHLLLPALPPSELGTPALVLAAQLPAFYSLTLDPAADLDDPKLLRARLEQGVPPAIRLGSPGPAKSAELALLAQRGLFQLGQTYFWAEPFERAASIEGKAPDGAAALITALAKVLAHGPRNAAAMMLGPPTLPHELRNTAAVDALAQGNGPLAGLAEFDAAYVRGLSPPAGDPAFWKDQAARYQRAQKKLDDKTARAAAGELAKAARDTERALRQEPKP